MPALLLSNKSWATFCFADQKGGDADKVISLGRREMGRILPEVRDSLAKVTHTKEKQMAYFDDFANAVKAYLSLSVTLNPVIDNVKSGTPGAVNVNEVWTFKVTVDNSGELNLTSVQLYFQGHN